MSPRIFVYAEEPQQRRNVAGLLRRHGFGVVPVQSRTQLGERLRQPPLVIVAVLPPEPNAAVAWVRDAREAAPMTELIGLGDADNVGEIVTLINAGAFGYVCGCDDDGLLALVHEAVEVAEEHRAAIAHGGNKATHQVAPLASRVPAVRAALRQALAAVQSQRHVVLVGEPGSGRKSLARALHSMAPRPGVLRLHDCRSLEPFYSGVSTTSATGARTPTATTVLGNTICLLNAERLNDDALAFVARLNAPVMVKLSDASHIAAHYRVVAIAAAQSSTKPGHEPDIVSQLSAPPYSAAIIRLPPLRERIADLPTLCHDLCLRVARRHGLAPIQFADDALALLAAYAWPSNLTELNVLIERLCTAHPGDTITATMLPVDLVVNSWQRGPNYREAMEQLEREFLLRVLGRVSGSRRRAAERLNVSYSTLKFRLRKLGIAGALTSNESND
jgi:DNA-binding NtrC family response regulator